MDNKIITILEEADYDNRIEILDYDKAIAFIEETLAANDEEITEEAITECIHDLSGGYELDRTSTMFYALHPNGNGRAFIYTPDGSYNWNANLERVAAEAYDHAYDDKLDFNAVCESDNYEIEEDDE